MPEYVHAGCSQAAAASSSAPSVVPTAQQAQHAQLPQPQPDVAVGNRHVSADSTFTSTAAEPANSGPTGPNIAPTGPGPNSRPTGPDLSSGPAGPGQNPGPGPKRTRLRPTPVVNPFAAAQRDMQDSKVLFFLVHAHAGLHRCEFCTAA